MRSIESIWENISRSRAMMWLSILPAMFFLVIPGIIIQISWSLALFILPDKGIAPGEAMIRSNKATYGYKWAIFGVSFLLTKQVDLDNVFAAAVVVGNLQCSYLGCNAVIYRNLTSNIAETD